MTTTLAVIGVIYAAVSLITFVVYSWDKRAAARGRSRVPESRLHLLELLGGWPGALIAQHLIRHKNRKMRFQATFIAIVLLHVAVWIGVVWAMTRGE